MFIHSSKKFMVRLPKSEPYFIAKGFVGEIPDEVAKSKIVQLAIKEGSISTPASKKDTDIEKAEKVETAKIKANQKKKEEA